MIHIGLFYGYIGRSVGANFGRQGKSRHDVPPITPTGLADGLEVGSPHGLVSRMGTPPNRYAPDNRGPPAHSRAAS